MGLFTTLASTTGANSNNEDGDKTDATANANNATPTTTSSASIPTVVQLYSGRQIILMEDTPTVSGYTSLTYQAVQVGASRDDAVVAELKNRHTNPDLGVWNCRVESSSININGNGNGNENSDPLVDSLLAKLASPSQKSSPVYCLTVDLSDETTVEPTMSALQAALVRHLIEHPPNDAGDDDAACNGNSNSNTKTQTTSLYNLQTVQFGLASEEKAAERSIQEAARDVKVGVMICAVVSSGDRDNDTINNTVDESSESAYKKKQARALVVYHLRKFASYINAALCFVERPKSREQRELSPNDPTAEDGGNKDAGGNSNTSSSAEGSANNDSNTQLSISYDKLSQLWRDMATGVPVWEQQKEEKEQTQTSTRSAETGTMDAVASVSATALYGPGRQQEDLIESMLLRNANYPGHWDASKDSLWMALPTATTSGEGSTAKTTAASSAASGDDGWLTQLRDSIASALPATTDKADEKDKSTSAGGGDSDKPKEKDAAVSSFFESLLKNP